MSDRPRLPERGDEAVWPVRTVWLRRWLAASWLVLTAATWRLWTPQTVFPQIPFLAALRTAPAWLDWLALAALLAGLLGLLAAPSRSRYRIPQAAGAVGWASAHRPLLRLSASISVAALLLLVLLDQHRFQPWAYQFAVAALVLAFTPAAEAASLLRVLTVGIYFWSAVSKFDYTFLHTTGTQLLDGLFSALRLYPYTIDSRTAVSLAWGMPIDELAVAILLAVRRTRTIGLIGSVAMHVLLLAALGPLGQNHEPGVLLWNVYFIGQNLLLFRRPAAGWRRTTGPGAWRRLRETARCLIPPRPSAGLGHAVVYAAVWLPALEPFGLFDDWPAWAVYAPGGERVRFLVADNRISRLPDELRKHVVPNIAFDYEEYRSDLWSLNSLSAPIYPQERFRVGVATAVTERYWLGRDPEQYPYGGALLVVEGCADRFTGKRSSAMYRGVQEIRDYAESFRLNALPRKHGGW